MGDLVQRLRQFRRTPIFAPVHEAADRIERLEASLRKANSQAEHFEREWYLRGDRIEQLERENAVLEKRLQEIQRMCLGYQEEHDGLRKDAELLDWLGQNFFSREMNDFDARILNRGEKYHQWVFFAPKNVQGDIRNVLNAAMKEQT